MWGRKALNGHSDNIIKKAVQGLAPKIKKEDFLEQLRVAWTPYIKKAANVEEELVKARDRINKSGPYKYAFDRAGITDDDLKQVIKDIQDNKPLLEIRESPKISRNSPCPCGSGKKYKKCCGK